MTGLYLALTTLILVASLTAAFATSFAMLVRDTARDSASLRALHVAEGGVARARAALVVEPAWARGEVEIGAGRAEVTVEPVSDRPGERVVRVRGVVPATDAPGATIERRIRAVVRVREGALPAILDWREEG